jgi:hypothetical protein
MTKDVLEIARNLAPGKVLTIGGNSKSKIDACNRDMDRAKDWNIVVLLSDDMIPQTTGWDVTILQAMSDNYSDTDGVLFFNDGFRKGDLNTMCILGKKYYDRFGYLYHPDYVSFYCDDEFTQVGYLLGKQKYFDKVIFKHEHPGNGFNKEFDQLYKLNEKNFFKDKETFNKRRREGFFLPSTSINQSLRVGK